MVSSLRVGALLWCVLLIPTALYAQAQASITGNVKDTSGAVLPGVTVEAASPELIEKLRTAVDRRDGPVSNREPASRCLHRDVQPGGVQHRQA